MLAVAAVLGVVALLLWQRASDQQEDDALVASYEQAILLDQGHDDLAATVDTDPDVNRTPALVAAGLAAVAAVAGLVTVARD